jgi:uncharacterized membrane protein YvbJ
MKYCSKCGTELVDEAVICPNCGCAVEGSAPAKPAEEDKASAGLCVLSVLIPLFGIIYWAVKHKDTPKKAKACGIAAIISWVAGFVLSMFSSILMMGALGSML